MPGIWPVFTGHIPDIDLAIFGQGRAMAYSVNGVDRVGHGRARGLDPQALTWYNEKRNAILSVNGLVYITINVVVNSGPMTGEYR